MLLAAEACPKFFPMMTYAAGTLRPAQVLVIGAGVAGLQAIATAKRLGAIVTAYDVRPETKEQIESLGAKFVDTGVSAAGTGGYARELSDEEKQQQAAKLGKAVAQVDALITTAAIPGKRAPVIISEAMVAGMKPGAVVVDMAAESGGNVAGTVAGQDVVLNGVTLIGPTNLPSRMALHASEMYAKNLFNFLSPFIKDGNLAIDWADEVIAGSTLTHEGQIRHEGVKKALGVAEMDAQLTGMAALYIFMLAAFTGYEVICAGAGDPAHAADVRIELRARRRARRRHGGPGSSGDGRPNCHRLHRRAAWARPTRPAATS